MLRYHERAMKFSIACVDMDMHDHKNDVSLLRKKIKVQITKLVKECLHVDLQPWGRGFFFRVGGV